MTLDNKTVEELVEIITREVLLAIAEQEEEQKAPEGAVCVLEIADGVKVQTCFDNAGHVVSAGAERLTSTVGIIPVSNQMQQLIKSHSFALKPRNIILLLYVSTQLT